MSRPFSLQAVLELMQTRADEATQQLARLIAAEQDARNKLAMLQQYRDEYALRFQQVAQHGLTPHEWRNYQACLDRLDEAIEMQGKVVTQQEKNTFAGQLHWKQQQKKPKAMDTLSERHFARENALALRSEQKMQDEHAIRRRKADD